MEFFTTETLFMAVLNLAEATITYFSFMVDGGRYVVWAGTEWQSFETADEALAWAYKKLARIAKDHGMSLVQEEIL